MNHRNSVSDKAHIVNNRGSCGYFIYLESEQRVVLKVEERGDLNHLRKNDSRFSYQVLVTHINFRSCVNVVEACLSCRPTNPDPSRFYRTSAYLSPQSGKKTTLNAEKTLLSRVGV